MSDTSSSHGTTEADRALAVWYAADDDPQAFLAVYHRYRGHVRSALERAGLTEREAERRVGQVFVELEERRPKLDSSRPLASLLEELAAAVASSSPSHFR